MDDKNSSTLAPGVMEAEAPSARAHHAGGGGANPSAPTPNSCRGNVRCRIRNTENAHQPDGYIVPSDITDHQPADKLTSGE